MPDETPDRARSLAALRVIGAIKLGKSLLFVALGCALVGLLGHESREQRLTQWVGQLRPGVLTHLVDATLRRALSLPIGARFVLEAGAFVYAALFAVEGGGLLAGRRWAEWLTVVSTALLVPFEIYEVVRHPTVVRVAALLANVAVLAYLVWRIRRDGRTPAPAGARRGHA